MRKWGLVGLICLCAGWVTLIQAAPSKSGFLSGSATLGIAGYPLPCTIVDEIKLKTPCERAVFSWDIEVGINLKCTFDSVAPYLSTVFGIPGIEHLVLGVDGTWGGTQDQTGDGFRCSIRDRCGCE